MLAQEMMNRLRFWRTTIASYSGPMRNFAITFDQRNLLVRFAAHEKRFTLLTLPLPTRVALQPDAPKPPQPGLVPVG